MQQIQALFAQAPEKVHEGIRAESHYLTMHDGVQVAVDVLLPADLESGTRIPVVLTMTRYWRSFELRIPEPRNRAPIAPREPLADDLVPRGVAMVLVDARGSGASTGVSRYPWTPEEIADYGESADWAAEQPWCNGHVGATGISYEGTTALLLTTTASRQLRESCPSNLSLTCTRTSPFPGYSQRSLCQSLE